MSEEGVTTQELQVPSLIDEIPQEPAQAADDKKPEPTATDKTEAEAETTEQQEQKKQSRFQRRLDAQKSARIAAETETRLLREQYAKLEAQLKAPTQESGEPRRDQFEDYESYLTALTKHEARQVTLAEIKAEREANQGREKQSKQQSEDARIAQDWTTREAAFQAETKDYLEVVTPYVEVEIGALSDGARRYIVEAGPQVLYHLAANPDVADKIAGLTPLRQVAELGKLEASISAPAAKEPSKAPAPIKPVNQGRTSVSGYRENMSQADYEALRKTQGARWAR
jgi:hypothetical protein